jgi:hypothetical protein
MAQTRALSLRFARMVASAPLSKPPDFSGEKCRSECVVFAGDSVSRTRSGASLFIGRRRRQSHLSRNRHFGRVELRLADVVKTSLNWLASSSLILDQPR